MEEEIEEATGCECEGTEITKEEFEENIIEHIKKTVERIKFFLEIIEIDILGNSQESQGALVNILDEMEEIRTKREKYSGSRAAEKIKKKIDENVRYTLTLTDTDWWFEKKLLGLSKEGPQKKDEGGVMFG